MNDFLSHIPTYGEIVDVYNIDVLKTGGDLQLTETGDIAITADGDLQFGDHKHNALHRLVQRWCFHAAMLQTLFRLVTAACSAKAYAENERNSIAGIAFTNRLLAEKFHSLGDEIGANEYGGAACAGAMMVVLSNLLMRFKADLKATNDNWENAEPLIEGYSVGAVVVAGANNFRHHDEWAKTAQPTEQQLRSIKVIAAVLKEPISNGISFRDNVCAKLLEAMSCGNFETLSERFFGFAKAMAA